MAVGCPQNPGSTIPALTLAQLTAGGGQDHGLQHLRVEWLLGQVPVSSPFWELGREGMRARSPGWPGSCPFCPLSGLRSSTLPTPHTQDLLPFSEEEGSLSNPSEAGPPFASPPDQLSTALDTVALRGGEQGKLQLTPLEEGGASCHGEGGQAPSREPWRWEMGETA